MIFVLTSKDIPSVPLRACPYAGFVLLLLSISAEKSVLSKRHCPRLPAPEQRAMPAERLLRTSTFLSNTLPLGQGLVPARLNIAVW